MTGEKSTIKKLRFVSHRNFLRVIASLGLFLIILISPFSNALADLVVYAEEGPYGYST